MPLRYWVFVFLTLGLTAAVSVATYRSSQLLRRWQPDRNLLLLFSENIIRLLLIALCIGLGWLSGLPPAQLGWAFAGWQSDFDTRDCCGAAVMAGGFYHGHHLDCGPQRGNDSTRPSSWTPSFRAAPVSFCWTALAMIGVVAAEELLFRSLLIGGMQPIAAGRAAADAHKRAVRRSASAAGRRGAWSARRLPGRCSDLLFL